MFYHNWTHRRKKGKKIIQERCERCKRWGQKETKKRFITKLNFWQKLLLYCTYIHTHTHTSPFSLTFFFHGYFSSFFLNWKRKERKKSLFVAFLALGYIISCCFKWKIYRLKAKREKYSLSYWRIILSCISFCNLFANAVWSVSDCF